MDNLRIEIFTPREKRAAAAVALALVVIAASVSWAVLTSGHPASTAVPAPPPQHNAVAAELRALARRPGETLTRSAVQALAAAGFEIGFHTRRHHLLTTLDAPALEAAMNEGRAEIEAVIGQRLRMIAYPHGKANRRVAEVARSTGYECAFTASPNPVGPSTDPLMIGRVEVPPAPLGTFVRIIVSALRANGT